MTARPKPVDLTLFEGMTQGEWHYSDVMCIPAVLADGGHKRVADSKGCNCRLETASNFKAIAALPNLIADLKATREERDELMEDKPKCEDCGNEEFIRGLLCTTCVEVDRKETYGGATKEVAADIVIDLDEFREKIDLDDLDPHDPLYVALKELDKRRNYYNSYVVPA